MIYLSVEEISKSYNEKGLFENLSFGIEQGQKIALVAQNGSGKTTLFKVLQGKETADSGVVAFAKGVKIEFLEQSNDFDENSTILEELYKTDNQQVRAALQYDQIINDPNRIDEMADALEKMDEQNAWDVENNIKTITSQLKLNNLDAKISTLSGGQKKRVALGQLLLSEPDLLFLDEPTNHLDLEMIEWLEDYLSKSKMSLFLVTHDRYFLESVCNEIYELADNTIYKYKGNYTDYLNKKAERHDQLVTETSKAKNLFKKELEWIRRQPKARGTKQKSRVDAFVDVKKKAHVDTSTDSLSIDLGGRRQGKKILELKDIDLSFGDQKFIDKFTYIFKRNERIGIVGKNGVGKSTFLNTVMGLVEADSGIIEKGETIHFGYYRQQGLNLPDDKRVIDFIKDIAEIIHTNKNHTITASQMLEKFLFDGKQQYQYISTLSGGERKRLYLLSILMENPNFLILDEPTNDLDIITLNILEDYLEEFPGCVLVVSHDRHFMDKVAQHLFIFKGDGIIQDFNGSYTQYWINQKEEDKQLQKDATQAKSEVKVEKTKSSKPKMSYKEKLEYEALEAELFDLEITKEELETKMANATPEDINDISQKYSDLVKSIEEKTTRWTELDKKSS
ncbi:ABC-F family ATP-binding cassette domain-containing protein [Cyclobacteriaceae bacterium]|nr:ABC-F family ATP-binding cassette domain-containing protein [Cyclobacteriaceae bacterium]